MKIQITLFLIFTCLLTPSCQKEEPNSTELSAKKDFSLPKAKIVDLSYDFSDKTVYWVNAKKFEKETVAEGKTDGGFYY
jgi:hypothetical protein